MGGDLGLDSTADFKSLRSIPGRGHRPGRRAAEMGQLSGGHLGGYQKTSRERASNTGAPCKYWTSWHHEESMQHDIKMRHCAVQV
jgi:hypothetical protein